MVHVRVAVGGIIRAGLQDAVHPEPSFIGPVVIQEIADLRNRRDAAGQVEMDAAEELRIVSEGRRLDTLVPGGGDALINSGGQIQHFCVRTVQGRRRRQAQHAQAYSQQSKLVHAIHSCEGLMAHDQRARRSRDACASSVN